MIASPCRGCSRKNQPKEKCFRECKTLAALQEECLRSNCVLKGFDDGEELRAVLPQNPFQHNQ